jgi:hypothetical protein
MGDVCDNTGSLMEALSEASLFEGSNLIIPWISQEPGTLQPGKESDLISS